MAKQGDNDRGVNLNASNVLLNLLSRQDYIIIDNKVMQQHYLLFLHKANVGIVCFRNP